MNIDADLERRVLRGESFTELVRVTQRPLLTLCLQLTRNRAEAEDALQETFLAVHRALGGFRGEAKLSTWMWRIAIRCALAVRARRPATAELVDEHVVTSPDLTKRMQLRRAVSSLRPEHRIVIALFAVEGLTHQEIADTLGVAEGTVWSRLHDARRELSRLLSVR